MLLGLDEHLQLPKMCATVVVRLTRGLGWTECNREEEQRGQEEKGGKERVSDCSPTLLPRLRPLLNPFLHFRQFTRLGRSRLAEKRWAFGNAICDLGPDAFVPSSASSCSPRAVRPRSFVYTLPRLGYSWLGILLISHIPHLMAEQTGKQTSSRSSLVFNSSL